MGLLIDAAKEAGITYRQADYWCRRGFIQAPAPGSGNARRLSPEETRVLRTMGRLVAAGVVPEVAARVARNGADGGGFYELGDGVHLSVTAPTGVIA